MGMAFLSSEQYGEHAHRYYSRGDYDRAVDVLREGLALYPSATELHVGLGYAYLAREDYAWARRAFEKALALDADQEDALVGLGETLLKLGERAGAVRAFHRVLELGYKDDVEMVLSMGRALFREGLVERAERFFRIATRVQPESSEAAAALGFALHRLGRDSRAVRWLRKALELDEECHEARIYLGNLYYERGDLERALKEFEAVPVEQHLEPGLLRKILSLQRAVRGLPEGHASLAPYRRRLRELEAERDAIDHLLAEVSANGDGPALDPDQLDLFEGDGGAPGRPRGPRGPRGPSFEDLKLHRVYTADGECYVGRWSTMVAAMRDRTARDLSVAEFMRVQAERWAQATGEPIPWESARAFLKAAARAGVLQLDP